MPLPNFIIAGGQRCSSTWLWTLCNQHPDIFMAQSWKPEPKYFSADYHLGPAHYASYFEAARGEPVLGEKSVTYLDHPRAAMRIFATLPEARIVFILRDPVARAHSHWRYSTMNLLESKEFRDALISEPWREKRMPHSLAITRPWAYFDRGRYAHYLQPYFDLFPRRQLLVIFAEEMLEAPLTLSAELFSFLGIPPLPDSVALPGSVNPAPPSRGDMDEQTREFLRARFASENEALSKLLERQLPPQWTRTS